MILPKKNLRAVDIGCTIGEYVPGIINGVKCNTIATQPWILCTSDKINIWAKYKPVLHTFTNNRPSDWWKGSVGDCSIERLSHGEFNEMFESIINGEAQYTHRKPYSIFRLGDFAGYDPEATPPIFEQDYSGTTVYNNTASYTFVVFEKQSFTDTELSVEDVWGPTGLNNMNTGAAFRRVGESTVYWMTSSGIGSVAVPVASYNYNIFKPGEVDMVLFMTERSKPDFLSSITGSGGFYAFPNCKVHRLKVIDSSLQASIDLTARYNGSGFEGEIIIRNNTGGNQNLTNVALQFYYPGDSYSSGVEKIDDIYVSVGETKTVEWEAAALPNFLERGTFVKLFARNQEVASTFIPMPMG